ncbi:MAG: hypothetical protein U0359_24240 [Byssovorax sp.]
MKRLSFLFFGALITLASLSSGTGCGGSSSSGTGGSTSTTTSTTTTTSGTGGTTGTGGTGGGGVTLDCTAYCTELLANCTEANAQFTTMETCMGTCAGYPVGTIDDKAGNTLGCRLYHGGAPALGAPDMHCPHAGITGGDNDPTDANAGVCGEACDSFCEVAMKVCGGQGTYADKAACMTECKTFKPSTGDFNTGDTSGDTFGCRAYHLTAASADAASAATHCPHIVANSPVCK